MKNTKLNFEDFKNEKLSDNHKKTVRGGDTEPGRANGAGSLQPQKAIETEPKVLTN